MERIQFQIGYCGSALDQNEMNVRDLAPALLSVADLLQEANRLFNANKADVSVNIKGSFRNGSFIIDFVINQNLYEQVKNLFGDQNITHAARILALFFGGRGLVDLLKWVKNRKIEKIEKPKSGKAKVILSDHESLEVDGQIIDMMQNITIRRSLEMVIQKPLSRDGVETFYTADEGAKEPSMTVNKAEQQYFAMPEVTEFDVEQIDDQVVVIHLEMVNISFQEGNKWRFRNGENTFYATVEDKDFINKVQENKIAFAKDDLLKVELRIRQWTTPEGLRSEHTITKILEYKPAMRQLYLPVETTDK